MELSVKGYISKIFASDSVKLGTFMKIFCCVRRQHKYLFYGRFLCAFFFLIIQGVPLATEPGISLIILPLMRILQRNLKRTADKFLFISHTKNVLLFKSRSNIFIGVRIIIEMPGSVASGTHCITRVY